MRKITHLMISADAHLRASCSSQSEFDSINWTAVIQNSFSESFIQEIDVIIITFSDGTGFVVTNKLLPISHKITKEQLEGFVNLFIGKPYDPSVDALYASVSLVNPFVDRTQEPRIINCAGGFEGYSVAAKSMNDVSDVLDELVEVSDELTFEKSLLDGLADLLEEEIDREEVLDKPQSLAQSNAELKTWLEETHGKTPEEAEALMKGHSVQTTNPQHFKKPTVVSYADSLSFKK